MTKQVRETKAGQSISAYVVLNKSGKQVATIHAHFADSGVVTVDIWDHKADLQQGRASGYGYDKFTAALRGLMVDGHELSNHCGQSIKTPKAGYFPQGYKPRKGYSLANFGSYLNGKRIYSDHWRFAAIEALGVDNPPLEELHDKMVELRQAAIESGALVDGWGNCYRDSGLDYLRSLGYRVIQAI